MTDHFGAVAASDSYFWPEPYEENTSDGGDIYTYKFRSPDKWLFSAAFVIGQTALVSADYERTNYKNMQMFDREGIANQSTNEQISDNLSSAGTMRIGAEYKVTPQFALRAGAAWIENPMNDALQKATEEVMTVGTIPHYTIENKIANYTFGFGYRFTPHFYMDAACVLKSQKEDLYAFSKIYANDGGVAIDSQPASLKTNSVRIALTFGYKF
jgi:long-subunit fatty acid transport protein